MGPVRAIRAHQEARGGGGEHTAPQTAGVPIPPDKTGSVFCKQQQTYSGPQLRGFPVFLTCTFYKNYRDFHLTVWLGQTVYCTVLFI